MISIRKYCPRFSLKFFLLSQLVCVILCFVFIKSVTTYGDSVYAALRWKPFYIMELVVVDQSDLFFVGFYYQCRLFPTGIVWDDTGIWFQSSDKAMKEFLEK